MGKVVGFLNKPVFVAIVVGLFLWSFVKGVVRR